MASSSESHPGTPRRCRSSTSCSAATTLHRRSSRHNAAHDHAPTVPDARAVVRCVTRIAANRAGACGECRNMSPTARAARPASSIARTVQGAHTPSLLTVGPRGTPRAAVVIAHGGKSQSTAPDSNLRSPALRMLPFLLDLARAGRRLGLASTPAPLPARRLQRRRPGRRRRVGARPRRGAATTCPVCLLGHSMGARAALRAAGHPSVVSVVALAPWCPPAEPVEQLEGRTVVIAHGARDRITDPARSLEFARHAQPGRRAARAVRARRHRPHDAPAPADVAVAGPPADARHARARPARGPARSGVRAAGRPGREDPPMIWFPRVVGVLTAAYGVSAVAMPGVIGRHGGYRGWESRESAVRLLSAVVGVRDIVSGIAIVVAPSGGVLLAAPWGPRRLRLRRLRRLRDAPARAGARAARWRSSPAAGAPWPPSRRSSQRDGRRPRHRGGRQRRLRPHGRPRPRPPPPRDAVRARRAPRRPRQHGRRARRGRARGRASTPASSSTTSAPTPPCCGCSPTWACARRSRDMSLLRCAARGAASSTPARAGCRA